MSLFGRAKEVTRDLAAASKRQAQRGKLKLELWRLESKVSSEKDALGHALFPLLEVGTLDVDLPDAHAHMKAIAELLGEIAQRKAEIEALRQDGGDAAEAVRESMRTTDANATAEASAEQSAKDANANESESPAEEGGRG